MLSQMQIDIIRYCAEKDRPYHDLLNHFHLTHKDFSSICNEELHRYIRKDSLPLTLDETIWTVTEAGKALLEEIDLERERSRANKKTTHLQIAISIAMLVASAAGVLVALHSAKPQPPQIEHTPTLELPPDPDTQFASPGEAIYEEDL